MMLHGAEGTNTDWLLSGAGEFPVQKSEIGSRVMGNDQFPIVDECGDCRGVVFEPLLMPQDPIVVAVNVDGARVVRPARIADEVESPEVEIALAYRFGAKCRCRCR